MVGEETQGVLEQDGAARSWGAEVGMQAPCWLSLSLMLPCTAALALSNGKAIMEVSNLCVNSLQW